MLSVHFLFHTTASPVFLLFALVAFLSICRTLSWCVNWSTKFIFLPIHDLSWSLLIFLLLSVIWSSFLFLCFLLFLISWYATHFFLTVHLFHLHLYVSSMRHMLIAFSSVISTPFLSRTSLISSDLIPFTTLYSRKLSSK